MVMIFIFFPLIYRMRKKGTGYLWNNNSFLCFLSTPFFCCLFVCLKTNWEDALRF